MIRLKTRALVFGLVSRKQLDIIDEALNLYIEDLKQSIAAKKKLETTRELRRRVWRLQERFKG